jgi:uncharacterized protein (DUF2147 family)
MKCGVHPLCRTLQASTTYRGNVEDPKSGKTFNLTMIEIRGKIWGNKAMNE